MLRQYQIDTQVLTQRLDGSNVFSKIDLVRAYYQILVEQSDVHKTVLTTPFGFFNFTRMPFGLRNSDQTFQCFKDHVTPGLDFVFVYLVYLEFHSNASRNYIRPGEIPIRNY